MDLAQAASIFKKSGNWKALGICYNNIANIQYKNNQFSEASVNFKKAVTQVQNIIKELGHNSESSKEEKEDYETVKAHRYY
jgi:hypothetical protein